MVKDGEIVIVDEFTGRLMFGRRYSDGLHQAIEAKEGVAVQRESRTLATVTFQNYFRLYNKLAGMTGTASTEAVEFDEIYGLRVVEVPTNRPVLRVDEDDEIYKLYGINEDFEEFSHEEALKYLKKRCDGKWTKLIRSCVDFDFHGNFRNGWDLKMKEQI